MNDQALHFIRDLVRGKRVLDIGDEDSPFLAEIFWGDALRWIVIGRDPPNLTMELPSNCILTNARFDRKILLDPSQIDVLLFCHSSLSFRQDMPYLEWATADHKLVFINSSKESPYNEAAVRQAAPSQNLILEKEFQDETVRLLVFRKSAISSEELPKEMGLEETVKVEEEATVSYKKHFPKAGERFLLAPSASWPGKRRGDKPPSVRIIEDWKKNSGAAVLQTGQLLHLHKGDLGRAF